MTPVAGADDEHVQARTPAKTRPLSGTSRRPQAPKKARSGSSGLQEAVKAAAAEAAMRTEQVSMLDGSASAMHAWLTVWLTVCRKWLQESADNEPAAPTIDPRDTTRRWSMLLHCADDHKVDRK